MRFVVNKFNCMFFSNFILKKNYCKIMQFLLLKNENLIEN